MTIYIIKRIKTLIMFKVQNKERKHAMLFISDKLLKIMESQNLKY